MMSSSNGQYSNKKKPKILLMGYNGSNNTGSEARLLAIIEDIRAVFGEAANITVPSLNPTYLRRYLKEGPNQHIKRMPPIYYMFLRKVVKKHDIVILVEGSCYMDSWASPLLWSFLCASKFAHRYDKPSLAYAVDSGKLSPANKRRVRRVASKTDLIITRTQSTKTHLESLGVSAPISVTADCAFTFKSNPQDEDILNRTWSEAKYGVVGFSPLDFHLWPVVPRPWGRKKYCYRWPYYFSHSKNRSSAREELIKGWAKEADRIIEKYDKSIALICMEMLDEPIAQEIHKRMLNPKRARIFSSREYNASQMTGILKNLDLLVTSRYHASVLSLSAKVPQIALGHDTRLLRLYKDLFLFDDYYIEQGSRNMWEAVKDKVDGLFENPKLQREKIAKGFEDHVVRARGNQKLLRDFVINRGFKGVCAA